MQRSARRSRTARLQALSSKTTCSRSRRGQSVEQDVAKFSSNATSASGILSGSRDFVVNNSTFNVQGERDIVALGMEKLSKHIINGAEYDSSLRDPPPQCHPGTRVQLHGKINMWFRNKEREKALLWLNGPAGVGKSAVIQTFAESLAESESLGATLFFSRPNNRKDPQRVFFTVAFQLATRIPAYRIYSTEQIALDPSLLNKGIKEQFRIFITKPFGNLGIGSGEGPWGILLDGLDECDGVDEQCKIIELVSEFVLKFPYAPLAWSISSRPEPHIVTTFNDEAVAPSHWSEYIPIDSTEACQDVERYLNARFAAMRKRYPYVPSSWPSEIQFLKLTNGALGLFIFARTAVRFMEDSDHADPVSRLNLILSVIDHIDVEVTDDHPFALLDALYTQILTSIPPTSSPTVKRILGFILCTRSGFPSNRLSYPLKTHNLTGTTIILGLDQNVVYSSLHKLHSVLEIPHPKAARHSQVSFLHASFGDYLTDWTRSKDFFIDLGESVDEVTRCLYKLHLDSPWGNKWAEYISQLSVTAGSSPYYELKHDARDSLYYVVTGERRSMRGRGPFKSQQDRSECLDILSQINTAGPSLLGHHEAEYTEFLFKLWSRFPKELMDRGLCRQLQLRDLKVDHLDIERDKPICFHSGRSAERMSPDSPDALQKFIAKLQSLQRRYPNESVLVCGVTPEKRNAFVRVKFSEKTHHYCIPYPF